MKKKLIQATLYSKSTDLYIVDFRYGSARWISGKEMVLRASKLQFTTNGKEFFRAKTALFGSVIAHVDTFIPCQIELEVTEAL